MILLFEEYQYKNADNIALIKQCVNQAYITETVFELSTWLYQAIAHFVQRKLETEIVKMSNVQEVASPKGEKYLLYALAAQLSSKEINLPEILKNKQVHLTSSMRHPI